MSLCEYEQEDLESDTLIKGSHSSRSTSSSYWNSYLLLLTFVLGFIIGAFTSFVFWNPRTKGFADGLPQEIFFPACEGCTFIRKKSTLTLT